MDGVAQEKMKLKSLTFTVPYNGFASTMRILKYFRNCLALQASNDKHRRVSSAAFAFLPTLRATLHRFAQRGLLSPVTVKLTTAKIILGFAHKRQYRRVKNSKIAPRKLQLITRNDEVALFHYNHAMNFQK